jgi:anhydro-N-acetylmuramic acid kinase
MALFIGLMSGTSLDGVDAVLVEFPAETDRLPAPRARAAVHLQFSDALRADLLALNRPGPNELHRAALAANALTAVYASAVLALLAQSGVEPPAVTALGAHGQTVRHRPGEFDGVGYTLQLLNGALLAEKTGIDVVCDLRSRDVAAGGQGAPLVPAFHVDCFGRTDADVAVLNLGGIANLTLLPARGDVRGFDCGPANVLMDGWCRQHTGAAFDDGGQWAASGRVDADLLTSLRAEPYFALPAPKSTGRDLFDADWLQARLASRPAMAPQDVMATLAELTATVAVEALLGAQPSTSLLLVCGGGAFNRHLIRRLQALLPTVQVRTSDAAGVPPDQVEALAFAWLAKRFRERRAGNLGSVTGAAGPRVLGALYPARLQD